VNREVERKIIAILRILSRSDVPLGARVISELLRKEGIELSERTVRYHLKIMDERGLTEPHGLEGRVITERGRRELEDALVSDKVGLVISKIDNLSYSMTFDIDKKEGSVILNFSLFPASSKKRVLRVMKEIYDAGYTMGKYILYLDEGQTVGEQVVPEGFFGIGTVCSITINGILIKAGIPVESKFGGILEIRDNKPTRFTDLVSYAGSSLDPLEIFIRSKMSDALSAARTGNGKILASFREIPAVALSQLEGVVSKIDEIGLNGVIAVGEPSQELFGVPVLQGMAGIAVIGGLNPIAAVEEAGIVSESRAMSVLADFSRLRPFWDIYEEHQRR